MKQGEKQHTTSRNEQISEREDQKQEDDEQLERTFMLRAVLLHSQRKFGEILRQICEIGGFTAGKLSRETTAELQRLVQGGCLSSDTPVGSLGPFTLCRIMAGTQVPSYYQVFLCVAVLGKHLNSQRFAEICQELDCEIADLGENTHFVGEESYLLSSQKSKSALWQKSK